ncbi:hypothetical protein [Streptomyces sp. NPDC059788]|uniref:hypothetical protein n=1 Tax=Streptomyces sp. NPDC059788 TaxID=3346948 RepID=UPI0036488F45
MNAFQQHMLDAYRAAQHGESAPVLPSAGDVHVQALREIRGWLRFRAVVTAPADRPLGRFRRAVRHAFTPLLARPARPRQAARTAPAEPLNLPPLGPSSASVSTSTMPGRARLGDPCG